LLSEVKLNNFIFKTWTGAFCPVAIKKALGNSKGDILVLGYNSFGGVDLSEEIVGTGTCLKRLSDFSAFIGGTIFCGIKTQILDIKHISVAVCGRGKVLDIVDRSCNPLGDTYGASHKLKIFSTSAGMVGLIVDSDCLSESVWQKIAPHVNVILCINRGSSLQAQEDVRLFSAAYKKPYIYVDDQGVEWHS